MINSSSLSSVLTTAWRWENVPRSTSCPLMRTGCPSSRRVAYASFSPIAQSSSSRSTMAKRSFMSFLTLRKNFLSSGNVLMRVAKSTSFFLATPVLGDDVNSCSSAGL